MKEYFSKFSERIAIITDSGRKISYKTLLGDTSDLFNVINKRCLVFCLCQNSYGSFVGYTSFISNKVVPLLLDSNIDEGMLDNLVETYRPSYIWMPVEKADNYNSNQVIYEIFGYVLIQLNFSNSPILNEELGLLLTTSGSTGSPKLVRLSYENLYSNAESIAEYLEITQEERPVTTLPMNYSFGVSVLNSHIIKGATILLSNYSLIQKEFWAFVKSEKATSISGVPYSFEILKRLRFFNMDLPDLKTITQAGGKLSLSLSKLFAEYAEQKGIRFFVMYGQTEATARMAFHLLTSPFDHIGSIGKPIPNGQLSVVNEDRVVLEENKVGELVYQGPNVSLGYAQHIDDLAKGDQNNGILFTGDLAYVNKEGYYFIKGRKKRFIKLFGNRVNLDEVEDLVSNVISNNACLGEDDKLVVYITDESRIIEIKQHLARILKVHHKAVHIKYIKDIPKTPAGKKMYSQLSID